MDDRAVVFEDWEAILKADVGSELRRPYREAIVKFRYWLRQTGNTATVKTFKEHLDWKKSFHHTAKQTGVGIRSPFDTL